MYGRQRTRWATFVVTAAVSWPGGADAQAGVVRGDDDIALERHDVGPGILVPEVPDVRGCAFGQHAGRAVRPAYDGVAGDVAESPRKVGPEDVGGGRDGGSIEGDGLIGYPREGDGGWECVEGRVGHVFHSQEGAGWDGRGPVARDAIEGVNGNGVSSPIATFKVERNLDVVSGCVADLSSEYLLGRELVR